MKVTCEVILDLIPLVRDGAASLDSEKLVQEHIERCKQCQREFNNHQPAASELTMKDEEVIFRIQRSLFIMQIAFLFTGALIGIMFTNTVNMFYNFLIMPLVGAASFFILKRKLYLALAAVFLLSFLWQVVSGVIAGEFVFALPVNSLFYSVIYTFLAGLGAAIAFLFKFAFKKG